MSGAGAAASPGRWNKPSERVVYAATTIAMAVLETAAHVRPGSLPLDRYVVRIDMPAEQWNKRTVVTPGNLPSGWDAIPGSLVAVRFGSAWYASARSLLLELPSAIIHEETIVIINSSQPDAGSLTASTIRRFENGRVFRP